DAADFLDHVDLLSAGVDENDVELGLLFSSFSRSSSAASSSNSNRSSGGDAPLLFEHLRQLSRLEDGQGRQVFNDLGEISHFSIPLKVRTGVVCLGKKQPYAASSFRA